MKKLLSVFLIIVCLPAVAIDSTMEEKLTANKIMQLMNNRDDGITRQQAIDMTLISKTGKKRNRQVEAFSKDYTGLVKTKMKFLSPASMKNTAMLIVDKEKQNLDDQWIYIPGLNSVKK